MKKVKTSQASISVNSSTTSWVKHSFSLWVSLTKKSLTIVRDLNDKFLLSIWILFLGSSEGSKFTEVNNEINIQGWDEYILPLSSQASKFEHFSETKHRFGTIQVLDTYFKNEFSKEKSSVNLNLGSVIGVVNSFCCYKPEELSNSF